MENHKKSLKVVLVSVGISRAEHPQFARYLPMTTVGLHYISAVLKQAGYLVEIINQTNEGLSNATVVQRIDKSMADYIFFSQFFTTRERIREIISKISKISIIVVGGHDATFHSILSEKENKLNEHYCNFDYIWQGESEKSLIDSIKMMEKQANPKILKGERIIDLNELPILTHTDYTGDVGFLSTSRGCLQRGCDICTTPVFYPDGWKARSVEHVEKEIINLKKAGKKFIFICDDNFLGFTDEHLERGHNIIQLCKKTGLKIMIMTTKEQILKADAKNYLSIWNITVFRCFIGIESGGEHVGKTIGKITNIGQHAKNSHDAIKALYKNGISLFAGWINFKPDSTFEELIEDSLFLYKNGSECANFTNLCQGLRLYEGTRIYEKHKHRNSKIISGEFDYDFDDPRIGELYRFLMFNVKNKTIDKLGSLIYEATDNIYIKQLQNDEVGRLYWKIRNEINELNFNFFQKCLKSFKEGNKNIDTANFIKSSKSLSLQLQNLNLFD